jgi:MFS family permease
MQYEKFREVERMPSLSIVARLGVSKANLPVFFTLLGAFLWYYLALNVMTAISVSLKTDYLLLMLMHSTGVILAGAIGLVLSGKRYKLLVAWTILGAVTSLLPLADPSFAFLNLQLICFAWGSSLGLGMPACLSMFAEVVPIEKRGRFGGLSLMLSFLLAVLINSIAQPLGLLFVFLSFGIIRLLGLIPLLKLGLGKKALVIQKRVPSYSMSTFFDKRFYLYIAPWLLFNFVDTLEGLLLRGIVRSAFAEYFSLMQLVLLFSLSVFALMGGVLCDMFGRRPAIILGLSIMGIAYAIISIAQASLLAWFFFFISDGIATGMFLTVFVALVWGDLAPEGSEPSYYYAGNLPLFLATIIQFFLVGSMTSLSPTNAFSLAAFFLFLAVLPILFAPETLPERKLRERELRGYIEKAKKTKEKLG